MINSKQFLEKNLCFRLNFLTAQLKVKVISDEDLDINIRGAKCLVLNPTFQNKQGLITDFEILFKIPFNLNMMKFVANYDMSIKIQKATFDLNKKMIKKFTKWFVCVYTLKKIIKTAKKIILLSRYQDDILRNEESKLNQRSGYEEAITYENYRDKVIPKRLKINVIDGITMSITDECKPLNNLLDNARLNK